jgi:hypothetical protein
MIRPASTTVDVSQPPSTAIRGLGNIMAAASADEPVDLLGTSALPVRVAADCRRAGIGTRGLVALLRVDPDALGDQTVEVLHRAGGFGARAGPAVGGAHGVPAQTPRVGETGPRWRATRQMTVSKSFTRGDPWWGREIFASQSFDIFNVCFGVI